MLRTSLGPWCWSRSPQTCRSKDSLFNRRSTLGVWIASSMCRLPVVQGRSGTRARTRCIRRLDNRNSCRASTTLLRGGALREGGGGCYIGHVPQDPLGTIRPLGPPCVARRRSSICHCGTAFCIRQLQETAHVITMHMPLTPQMPECFFPSAAAANVPHDVVHNKFMALMHCICRREISADGLHRRLHMSPTCPFRRTVCRGAYTCLLLVLFGGWSAEAFTHISHVSFSAEGLHRRLHTSLLLVLFGG